MTKKRRCFLKENKERKASSGWNEFTKYEDADWDWSALFRMVYFKVKRMCMYFQDTCDCLYSRDKNKILKQMDKVLEALERWYANDYLSEEFDTLEKNWGKILFTPADETEKWFIMHHKKADTLQKRKQCDREYDAYFKKVDRLEKKDFDFVFDYLKEHLQEWWD